MCIDGGIPCRARERIAFFQRNVLASVRIAVVLCEAKVNDIHSVSLTAATNEKVLRLDISVQQLSDGVNRLDAGDELVRQKQCGLQ